MSGVDSVMGIPQLSWRSCGPDRGMWLWRSRFLSVGPAEREIFDIDRLKAGIERMAIPMLEAEADGWHVWVPTPGRTWATHWMTYTWPEKPPKPHFPSLDDYKRARRDDKLKWVHQFLVTLETPEKDWPKVIKRIATRYP